MVMSMGAKETNQESLLDLLWYVRKREDTTYVMKEKEKKWVVPDPDMPKNLDNFRKVYSNSCQGFHLLTDAEKSQEANGKSIGNAGHIVKSSFQGPVPEGERVDHKKQHKFQGMMTKAQAVVEKFANETK